MSDETKEREPLPVRIVEDSPKDNGDTVPVETVDQDFTYATHTDPARTLPGGGPYLDDVERVKAEIVRAKVEGREPDLANPPAYQGSVLEPTHVAASRLPGDFNVQSDVTLPVVTGGQVVHKEGGPVDAPVEPTRVNIYEGDQNVGLAADTVTSQSAADALSKDKVSGSEDGDSGSEDKGSGSEDGDSNESKSEQNKPSVQGQPENKVKDQGQQ